MTDLPIRTPVIGADVEKLIRAKYQDNLEMMQWFKSFYERNYAGQPYDAPSRRAKGRGADTMAAFTTHGARADDNDDVPGAGAGAVQPRGASAAGVGSGAAASKPAAAAGGSGVASGRQSTGAAAAGGRGKVSMGASGAQPQMHGSPGPAGGGSAALSAATKRIGELTGQIAELRLSVESLERERDFYFGKLRDIEILLQTYNGPDAATVQTLFKILYATEDDFVQVEPPAAAGNDSNAGGGAAPAAGDVSGNENVVDAGDAAYAGEEFAQ